MVGVNYDFPKDLHQRLKVQAALQDKTVKALLIELVDKGLAELEKEQK
jgi:hypothetical protein